MNEDYLTREKHRYSKISPGAIYESQVQILVERNIESIFPGYVGKLMEPYLRTAAGDVKPDLVLLKHDFTGWALVEVEIDLHSFRGHILPQISKLKFAEANDSVVKKITDGFAHLASEVEIENALANRPKVFLLTHGSSVAFTEEIERLSVEPIDIDIHESIDQPNEYILSVCDRTNILISLGVYANRSRHPMTKMFWTIESPELFSRLQNSTKVEVIFEETRSLWEVKTTHQGVVLRQPSDLLQDSVIVSAEVFFNEENGTINLVS